MDRNLPYRSPYTQHGEMSPPPSAKPTMFSPIPQQASSTPVSSIYEPPSASNGQLALYSQPTGLVSSPSPIVSSTYPVPSSQSTRVVDQSYLQFDDEEERNEYLKFKQTRREQSLRQPPPNMMLPNTTAPQRVPPFTPQYHQQYQQDSGYGSGSFQNAGQFAFGLPGQTQHQQYAPRPGHRYGKVTATGNSRVVQGNVIDAARGGNVLEKQHIYDVADLSDKARMVKGDVTVEMMRGFWD